MTTGARDEDQRRYSAAPIARLWYHKHRVWDCPSPRPSGPRVALSVVGVEVIVFWREWWCPGCGRLIHEVPLENRTTVRAVSL